MRRPSSLPANVTPLYDVLEAGRRKPVLELELHTVAIALAAAALLWALLVLAGVGVWALLSGAIG